MNLVDLLIDWDIVNYLEISEIIYVYGVEMICLNYGQ